MSGLCSAINGSKLARFPELRKLRQFKNMIFNLRTTIHDLRIYVMINYQFRHQEDCSWCSGPVAVKVIGPLGELMYLGYCYSA